MGPIPSIRSTTSGRVRSPNRFAASGQRHLTCIVALRPAGWVVASLLSGVGGKMILLCSLAANRSVTTRATTTMVRIGKTEQNRKPQFHSDPLLLCFAARPTDRTDSTDRDDRVGMIKTHSRSESEQIESRAVRATAKHSSGTNAMPEFREKRER